MAIRHEKDLLLLQAQSQYGAIQSVVLKIPQVFVLVLGRGRPGPPPHNPPHPPSERLEGCQPTLETWLSWAWLDSGLITSLIEGEVFGYSNCCSSPPPPLAQASQPYPACLSQAAILGHPRLSRVRTWEHSGNPRSTDQPHKTNLVLELGCTYESGIM